ncbi:MAG: xanthine dehydrogenase accessory protein XdhC [Proteobacteria bacterium]|nr:xanthine dehydrogenase accessory protein XdhC [Pseudomonadota bacterium]
MTVIARARSLVAAGETVAIVRVSRVWGSAPREEGATMLVSARGTSGSIGGGTLEWKALAEAQRMLARGPSRAVTRHALGPDLGQCCGGQVELATSVYDASNLATLEEHLAAPRQLYLFGAGHVGRALVFTLSQTDVAVTWIDPRPNAFPSVVPGNVTMLESDDAAQILAAAPQGSLVYVMTHSHALDLVIVDASLRQPAIAATALIGSATKRARFEKRLREANIDAEQVASLICPIGIGGIASKKPEAIAISAAAQILAVDERLKREEASSPLVMSTRQARA